MYITIKQAAEKWGFQIGACEFCAARGRSPGHISSDEDGRSMH